MQVKILTSRQKAELAVKACYDKKAEDLIVLDVRKVSDIADYFVIASAGSAKRIGSIADNLELELKAAGARSSRREGESNSLWVILDFNDCIVHIFHNEVRKFYNLERLWRDAKIVKINDRFKAPAEGKLHEAKRRHSSKGSGKRTQK